MVQKKALISKLGLIVFDFRVRAGTSISSSSVMALPTDMTNLMAFPTFVGSAVFIYNKFSFPQLAVGQKISIRDSVLVQIYLGNITRWNDPQIKATNPGIELPDRKIIVVARSDYTSGATSAVRKIFNMINPKFNATETEPWPYFDMLTRDQYDMIAYVTMTPYSLGFSCFEQIRGSDVEYIKVRNSQNDDTIPTQSTINVLERQYCLILGRFKSLPKRWRNQNS